MPLSAGTTLTAALFAHVIDRDRVELVDFGTGDDPYKRDWMEQVRPRYRLACWSPRQPAQLAADGQSRAAPTCFAAARWLGRGTGKADVGRHHGRDHRRIRDEADRPGAARWCADVLGLTPERVAGFTAETGLFGHLPELDSMAVAGLLTEIEDRLGVLIDDDEVDGEMLETYGALLGFVAAKLGEG